MASEKLRASFRQGKCEREGDSAPEWSDDEDVDNGHNGLPVDNGNIGECITIV